MIKVDNETVEISGKFLDIINDLTNVMSSIREAASSKSDERQIDELFIIATELSKKKPEEITLEYRKLVHEVVKARLSKKEPVDWTKVPVDTKIFVRDDQEDEWQPRYFAKFKHDHVYAWQGGNTSFTATKEEISPWAYAKLAEDGDEA